jgi:nucleotide sugar dehydrogenase
VKITVVGAGRMGLPLACVFARRGAHVAVSDINAALVSTLQAGECPYEEPGLPELVAGLRQAGRLTATTDTAHACAQSEVIVVIVPAHLTPERDIDFERLQAASLDVARGLQRGAMVVYETTVSVGGTRRRLIPALEKQSGLRAGRDFDVAYSPERVKANLVLSRLENTPKVVGGLDEGSSARALRFYSEYLGAPVKDVGSLEAAEMTKLLGMLYRDVNIALANELAGFCEIAGVDFDAVRAAANSDGEAGLLLPGIGVGGHCTPIYPYFLTRESRRLGLPQRISEAAREINDCQPSRQLERIATCWGPLSGQAVHLLGLGFRPGVKVDTCSPAYTLRDELQRRGAAVTLSDPYYTPEELQRIGFTAGKVEDARVVVLNTAHPQFSNPDFSSWRKSGVEVVLDGRNFWNQTSAERAGLLYFGIGRPSRHEPLSRNRSLTDQMPSAAHSVA